MKVLAMTRRIIPEALREHRALQLVLVIIAMLVAAQPADAHWCNSGGRLTNIERAICSDGGLINKDIELNRLYAALGGSRNAGLKAAQRSWMSRRNRCTSMDCLHSYYDDRLRALRAMAGGPATPAPAPAPTYTPAPPPPAVSAPAAPSAPSSGSLEKLPDIKPF